MFPSWYLQNIKRTPLLIFMGNTDNPQTKSMTWYKEQ